MFLVSRLINLDHLPIGFSSPIGCSFLLEEAINPESAKDFVRYPAADCARANHAEPFGCR